MSSTTAAAFTTKPAAAAVPAPVEITIKEQPHALAAPAAGDDDDVAMGSAPASLKEFEAAATDDVRIDGYDPLIQPALLAAEIPLTANAKRTVVAGRAQAAQILAGADDRLLVVVGPCSVHDVEAGREYAARLLAVAKRLQRDVCIVMRTYFEKPRTTVGWKGLINDPDLDGSFQINKGLRIARKFLADVTDSGMPVAIELLDTISPQYLADLFSYGAIGARTTESQLHRELASGVSFPVGFKNGTDGRLGIAIDAIVSAAHPHHFLGVTKHGNAAITRTRGNEWGHAILRGGAGGTNYDEDSVRAAAAALAKADLAHPRVMVDCSHGNSRKVHTNQIAVADEVARQVAHGSTHIFAVMLESFLVEGRQNHPEVYGKSITDACLSWDQTVPVLERLAEAVRARRARLSAFH
ncbi:3-deoxy-7-phosphoheptulonate synthase [Blastocladiella emersonii ATCC 22665]|nr:3-deoxy-7-phosphoheptulonate synthase [Blastocladiella emersonii ATCC 22665]